MASFEIMEALESVQKHLQLDLDSINSKSDLTPIQMCPALKGGPLDNPGRISVNMAEIALLWDRCHSVILAQSSRQTLSLMIDKFSTVLIESTIKVLSTIRQMSELALDQGDLANLAIIMSNLALIRNRLWLYKNQYFSNNPLNKDSRNKEVLQKQYLDSCELLTALLTLLTEQHVAVMSVVVVVEKPFFKVAKVFYDNDKISNSIQMWWLHLKRVRWQMIRTMPPKQFRKMMASFIDQALHIFAIRYCRAGMSSRSHTLLLQADLISLLLMVSELLPTILRDPENLEAKDDLEAFVIGIHNKCQIILATLIFVTAPINVLFKVLNNKEDQEDNKDQKIKQSSKWLRAIRPDMYNNSLFLCLRMLTDSAEPNFELVVRVLLVQDGQVVSAILEALGPQKVPEKSQETNKCTLVMCQGECAQRFGDNWSVQLLSALIRVLIEAEHEHVLLPLGHILVKRRSDEMSKNNEKGDDKKDEDELEEDDRLRTNCVLYHALVRLMEHKGVTVLQHFIRECNQGSIHKNDENLSFVVTCLEQISLHVPAILYLMEHQMNLRGFVSKILLDTFIRAGQLFLDENETHERDIKNGKEGNNDQKIQKEKGLFNAKNETQGEKSEQLQRLLMALKTLNPSSLKCRHKRVKRIKSRKHIDPILRAGVTYHRLLTDRGGQLALQTCHAFLVANSKWVMHKVCNIGTPKLIESWNNNEDDDKFDPYEAMNRIGDKFDCRQRQFLENHDNKDDLSTTNVLNMDHDWRLYLDSIVDLNLELIRRLVGNRDEDEQTKMRLIEAVQEFRARLQICN